MVFLPPAQYPQAELHVQRGIELDKVFPPAIVPSQRAGTIKTLKSVPAEPASWVTRVIIREQGHLKNGLKCRVATRLFTQPGVSLCPYAKK